MRLAAKILAAGSLAIGVIVLTVGWGMDVAAARTVLPGLIHMAPLTATGLTLGATSLLLLIARGPESRTARFLSALLLLLGLVILAEYVLGVDARIDNVLFPESLGRTSVRFPGRPAPNTAFGLVLLGLSLLTFRWNRQRSRNVSPALALVAGLIALQAVIGYAIGVAPLYRVSVFSPIAVHTGVGILLLSAATLCALPDRGLTRLMIDEGPSGYIARRLVPVAVLAPFLIEWLELQGERHRLFGSDVGTSLVIVAGLVVTGGAVWASAVVLSAAEEQRRGAERALRESEARFRTLADNIPQLAWMADPSGAIFWYNRRWFEYTGTTLDGMRGWGWQAVHHPDRVDGVTARFRAAIEAGREWEDTFPLRGRDGEYRWFLSRAQPIRDEAGRVVRWFGTNTDVTEDRLAAEEREHLLREADSANRAKADFLATMSHELRTPLNAIIGYADLLDLGTPDALPEKANFYVERIRLAARHQKQLIEDVLTFSRLEAGGERAVLEDCRRGGPARRDLRGGGSSGRPEGAGAGPRRRGSPALGPNRRAKAATDPAQPRGQRHQVHGRGAGHPPVRPAGGAPFHRRRGHGHRHRARAEGSPLRRILAG